MVKKMATNTKQKKRKKESYKDRDKRCGSLMAKNKKEKNKINTNVI